MIYSYFLKQYELEPNGITRISKIKLGLRNQSQK